MTDREKRNAAKVRVGIYMMHYVTLTTKKESVLVGTKSEVKARLRAHGGLLNDVIVQRCEGSSWKTVLRNSPSQPVNTLLSEKELWAINAKNMSFDHLEDFFGGILPLPVDTVKGDTTRKGSREKEAEKESTVEKRSAKYVMHRVATGVERALGCTILAQLPEVEVVSDCPKGKHGYYIDGSNKIYIDKSTVDLGIFFRDECLCHELIHWLGISSEKIAHRLDAKSVAHMPRASTS